MIMKTFFILNLAMMVGILFLASSSLAETKPPLLKVPGTAPPGAAPPPGTTPPPKSISDLASTAIRTASLAKKYFSVGPAWLARAPRAELIIKVAILYDGTAVTALEFDPTTGQLLPKGYHPLVFQAKISPSNAKRIAEQIIPQLLVLNGVEFRMPENCFVVHLAYQNLIVGNLKIYSDAIHVLPDYPLDSEVKRLNTFTK